MVSEKVALTTMELPLLWDALRTTLYDHDQYLSSLTHLLGNQKGLHLFDACAGTGEPGFDLFQLGYNIDFNDSNLGMVTLAAKKARERGWVISTPDNIYLTIPDGRKSKFTVFDIRALHGYVEKNKYDAVLLLGNSLPYLHEWDINTTRHLNQFSLEHSIEITFRSLYDIIAPGGRLIIEHINQKETQSTEELGDVQFKGKGWSVILEINYVSPEDSSDNPPLGRACKFHGKSVDTNERWIASFLGFFYSAEQLEHYGKKAGFTNFTEIPTFSGSPYSVYILGK